MKGPGLSRSACDLTHAARTWLEPVPSGEGVAEEGCSLLGAMVLGIGLEPSHFGAMEPGHQQHAIDDRQNMLGKRSRSQRRRAVAPLELLIGHPLFPEKEGTGVLRRATPQGSLAEGDLRKQTMATDEGAGQCRLRGGARVSCE